MSPSDYWWLYRERILAGIAIAMVAGGLFLLFAVFGQGSERGDRLADCVPGDDPIQRLASPGEFELLSPKEAVRVNPRLNELDASEWPVVYWWQNGGERGVFVSVLKGAWHGFNGDQRYDITTAAYGPGTAIEPTHIHGYEGYEQYVPRKPGHTVAFETPCEQVGFYGRDEADAKAAAEELLPMIDPTADQPPLGSSPS